MNHLLRERAPITEAGWNELDDEAKERLEPALAARKVVDFGGPHGWDYSATNLGRVAGLDDFENVGAARRRVLPVVELRAAFTVSRSELDDLERGAEDVDLGALDEAARRIAHAENVAVFHGWQEAGHPRHRRGLHASRGDAERRLQRTTRATPPRRSRRSCAAASAARTRSLSAPTSTPA